MRISDGGCERARDGEEAVLRKDGCLVDLEVSRAVGQLQKGVAAQHACMHARGGTENDTVESWRDDDDG